MEGDCPRAIAHGNKPTGGSACGAGAPRYVRPMADSSADLRNAVTRISHDRDVALEVVGCVLQRAGAVLARTSPEAWNELRFLVDDARGRIHEWGSDEEDAALDAWREAANRHRTFLLTRDQHALRALFEALVLLRRWRARNAELWWPGDPVNACVKALGGVENDPAGVLLGDVLTAAGFDERDHAVAGRVADQVWSIDEWRSAVARLTQRR